MSMKHVLLIALVLVNLVLLAGVVMHAPMVRQAQAQVMGGANAYAVVTARLQGNEDALWVLNLRTRYLTVLRLPQPGQRLMTPLDTRDLVNDLRAGIPAER